MKEVKSGLLVYNFSALGQGKKVVHVDVNILEELGRGAWGESMAKVMDVLFEVFDGPTGGSVIGRRGARVGNMVKGVRVRGVHSCPGCIGDVCHFLGCHA